MNNKSIFEVLNLHSKNEFLATYLKEADFESIKFLALDTKNMVNFLIDWNEVTFPNITLNELSNVLSIFPNYSLDYNKETLTIYWNENSYIFSFIHLWMFLDPNFINNIFEYINWITDSQKSTFNQEVINNSELQTELFKKLWLLDLNFIQEYYPFIKDLNLIKYIDIIDDNIVEFSYNNTLFQIPLQKFDNIKEILSNLWIIWFSDFWGVYYLRTKSWDIIRLHKNNIWIINNDYLSKIQNILDKN